MTPKRSAHWKHYVEIDCSDIRYHYSPLQLLRLCKLLATISSKKHLVSAFGRYGINYPGKQITQWEFQNKETSSWTGKSSFVLEVPLRYLRLSITM